MDPVERLIEAVVSSGYKRVRIATDAGMSATKLSKIVNRKQVPTVAELIAIAQAIKLDPSRLFTDKDVFVQLDDLVAIQSASNVIASAIESMLPVREPASFASGAATKPAQSRQAVPVRAAANPNAEMVVEFEALRKRIPRDAWVKGARIIVRVVGDSMDGGPDPIRDGELAYLKRLAARARLPRKLVSTNPSAETIEIDAATENVQIYGYVVDHRAG